ncbi:MAG: class I SAM-dependent methyltransferase [Planctomycetota bacterium]
MKIDIKDLLGSVLEIHSAAARIGLPDDPTLVDIVDSEQFCTCLDDALRAFCELRGGADYVVSANINEYHQLVQIRFVQRQGGKDRNGQVEQALQPAFRSLRAMLTKSGGELSYWGGNNYFDVNLPFHGPMRDAFPDVEHLPWNDRYGQLLKRASWSSLRNMVFRFGGLAESFAARCAEFQMTRVFIPSVGLCVHPWLFAAHGLSVVATDCADTALAALSEPTHWPQLYSQAAFDRWDIAQSASYATQGNPEHFTRFPDLMVRAVRESLSQRITFTVSDWADCPMESGSIDAIFATNALPRTSTADQTTVLKEWTRIVRQGGLALIAQHNMFDSGIETVLCEAGWIEANILGGARPIQPDATGFQIHYSSG